VILSEDLILEAQTLIGKATEEGALLRTLGGLAIKYHCPSASQPPLTRSIADIDLFGLAKQTKAVKKTFIGLGYVPAQQFNALHGKTRLMFFEPKTHVRRDVFLDVFVMCHKFEFRNRLGIDSFTISLSDLLMTKLQVVEIEERDYKDIACLLADHELATEDAQEVINSKYIAGICSADWGIYRTFTQNLDKTLEYVKELNLDEPKKATVVQRAKALKESIEKVPKSMQWKFRDRVGDKMVWYELPETPKAMKLDG
jgi:hypothetical protein